MFVKKFKRVKLPKNSNFTLINNNNTLKKRLRQNNINIASKKSRLRKQKKMNLMNDHINKLHLLILNENINYQSLLDEISNFNNNIIIFTIIFNPNINISITINFW